MSERIGSLRYGLGSRLYRLQEESLRWLAWRLPRPLVYWCAIRLWAHATTGRYGTTIPSTLPVDEALRR